MRTPARIAVELRRTIRVDWTLRMIFTDARLLWHTVGSACARENEVVNAGIPHCFQKRQASRYVVAMTIAGVDNRLAHIGISGEVHDRDWLILREKRA